MWIDLSHTVESDMAQWRGDDQPLKLHRRSEHGPDSHMSSSLEIGCHVGTHLDAPLHFLAGEPGLAELPITRFLGPAMKLDVSGLSAASEPGPLGREILDGVQLESVAFLLLHTGWDQHWGTSRYYDCWPYLSGELAECLASAGLRGVGLDTPSLDDYSGHIAHDVCAEAGMVNIENLTNLAALPASGFLFQALPLKLDGTEASPVRAVAWLNP